MADTVWVVGGGLIQIPLIREYQARGYEVIVSDRDPDCAAKEIADGLYVIDTYDILTHERTAYQMNPRPVAVMTAGTDVGPTVSAIAERCGLRSVPYAVADGVRDKEDMRWSLSDHFEHPDFRIADATHPPTELPFERTVVKPVNGSASRGVSLITDPANLAEAIAKADACNHYGDSEVVLEEALEGQEYATDWFVVDGEAIYINGVARYFREFAVEWAHVNPFVAPPKMVELATVAADALGVTEGPFKIDWIEDPRYGFCILEAATRWGGSFDHGHAQVLSCGRNLVKVLVDYSVGLPFDHPGPIIPQRYISCSAPQLPEGMIIGETLKSVLWRTEGVVDIIATGDKTRRYRNLAERNLFVFTEGATADEALDRARKVETDYMAWHQYTYGAFDV